MSTDVAHVEVDGAWGQIPAGRVAAASKGTFTRRRIDRIAAIAAGVGCAVLGVQAFIIALGDDAGIDARWQPAVLWIVFGTLAVMCVACLFPRTARIATGVFASIYIVLLAVWPLLGPAGDLPATPEPWPWYLINVATMAAVIAFPLPLQVVWTLATPLIYGVSRVVAGPIDGEHLMALIFEVPYSLILGGLLLTLATIFRRMASGVDRERTLTVSRYARAAESQASQEERVSVSALMHDSVLAALIAAERADSPRARSLAVSMAREALEGLADTDGVAASPGAEPVSYRGLARGIQASLADLGVRLEVRAEGECTEPVIPAVVAAAFVRAATQAVANSVQHADGEGLSATVGPPPDRGDVPAVQVVVRDRGPGFDIAAVPADRLGISASIIARTAAVDGVAEIESGPDGTVVSLRWTGGMP